MLYIRVLAKDALAALRVLYKVNVAAAGTMYVTFECDFAQREALTRSGIFWTAD